MRCFPIPRRSSLGATAGLAVAAMALLLLVACGAASSTATVPVVTIESPRGGARIVGDSVTLKVRAEGIRIVEPDGSNDPGKGHYHVYVDRELPAVGEVIPKGQPGIIHSAKSTIVIPNLAPGPHHIGVMIGDGRHVRTPAPPAVIDITTVAPPGAPASPAPAAASSAASAPAAGAPGASAPAASAPAGAIPSAAGSPASSP
ncbi:MAG TPA: DUF4399 domain-containing protein [Candidatus Sulfotelmatobacter sp.]|nr:DUF4399 domain-containing protein [Candidatus Sulfotelmatobacter sp.]